MLSRVAPVISSTPYYESDAVESIAGRENESELAGYRPTGPIYVPSMSHLCPLYTL